MENLAGDLLLDPSLLHCQLYQCFLPETKMGLSSVCLVDQILFTPSSSQTFCIVEV